MAGLSIIIDRAGTGELLRPLHSAGLTDYSARYYVEAETPPTKLADRVGGDHLTSGTSSGLTVNTAGTPYLSLTASAQLNAATLRNRPVSFAAVIRAGGQGTKLNIGAGYTLSIPSSPYWQMSLAGGGYVLSPVAPSETAWHLVIGVANGLDSRVWVNSSNTTTAPAGVPTTPVAVNNVPLSVRSHATLKTDVRELIVWDRLLTETDRETIRTALRKHHTDIPV